MSDRSLSDEVRSWLTKTGLPLELETAAAFKKAGFGSDHSSIYIDPETDKGREIDVIAFTGDNTGIIQVFVVGECKSSPNPWVVFTNKDNYSHLTYFALGVTAPETRKSIDPSILTSSSVTPLLKELSTGGYSVRQAFSKDNDQAYAAAITALKASSALVNSKDLAPPRLVFAFPVIVVDSPIFECHLDHQGELQFKQVEITEFLFTAMIPDRTKAVIRVVSRAALPEFASQFFKLAECLKLELDYKVREWWASIQGRT